MDLVGLRLLSVENAVVYLQYTVVLSIAMSIFSGTTNYCIRNTCKCAEKVLIGRLRPPPFAAVSMFWLLWQFSHSLLFSWIYGTMTLLVGLGALVYTFGWSTIWTAVKV